MRRVVANPYSNKRTRLGYTKANLTFIYMNFADPFCGEAFYSSSLIFLFVKRIEVAIMSEVS